MVLGIDEVGRGALAGEVTICGCLLSSNLPQLCYKFNPKKWTPLLSSDLKLVTDSKLLTSKNREKVANLAKACSLKFIVLSAGNNLIDEFGIGVCLSYLVSLAIFFIDVNDKELKIIIDGKIKILESLDLNLLNKIYLENKPRLAASQVLMYENEIRNGQLKTNKPQLIKLLPKEVLFLTTRENKADSKYLSVAMASNLAKVSRDQQMIKIGQLYPVYNWQQNKGYGTEENREAIKKYPENIYLRKTFLSRILN